MTLSQKKSLALRWVLAGPLTLIGAVITMACMPIWLPKGDAGVDNLVFPIVLFPAFWAIFFFYAVLESKPLRGALVIGSAILIQALLIYQQF